MSRSMQELSRIEVSVVGAVWTILLARPELQNAHDLQTFEELSLALNEAEQDDDCRCIVLRGKGDYFCRGQDFDWMKGASPREQDQYGRWNVGTRERIRRHYKPVVAAVNGPAIGGGAYLATSCDLIVAVDTAYFEMLEIWAGHHSGGAHLFSVGRARSMEMNLLGGRISATKAEAWGLINAAVPADEFDHRLAEFTETLCKLPPLSVRYTKSASNLLLDMAGYSQWLDAGSPMQRYLTLTPDGVRAKAAAREGKPPPPFDGEMPRAPDCA